MFSAGNSHLYVGRTRRLRRRLIEYSRPKMLDARLKALDRIRTLDIRYVEEEDPIRQTSWRFTLPLLLVRPTTSSRRAGPGGERYNYGLQPAPLAMTADPLCRLTDRGWEGNCTDGCES